MRPARGRTVAAAAAGVASVVFGAGLGELTAGLVAPSSSPFAAIGGALIDLAPSWAKDVAIDLFGTADKIALLVGIGIVLVAAAAAAGVLQWRIPPAGAVVALAFGAVGVLAAMTRADASTLAFLPSVVSGVAAALALRRLVRFLPLAQPGGSAPLSRESASRAAEGGPGVAESASVVAAGAPRVAGGGPGVAESASGVAGGAPRVAEGALGVAEGASGVAGSAPGVAGGAPGDAGSASVVATGPRDPDRRRFFAWAGAATAVGVVAVFAGNAIRGGYRAVTAARDAVLLPRVAGAPAVVPAVAELGIPGLAPVVTPNADFYRIDTALIVPQVDPATWRLRIHGLVGEEVSLTWDELLALPLEESVTTLSCVSNEVGGDLIGNALWLGYPIRELLARARPDADADMVLSTSVDGFTASTPLEALTDDRNAILAVGMNGQPLPSEHGFPVRMVVPGLYGYVSATKWVVDLEVTRFADEKAYWSTRGWSERGPIKLESRIDVPRRGGTVSAGDTVIAGVAWQPHVGVSGVEVQVDDGQWQAATLAGAISDDTWVQWSLPWAAASGSHTIRCRATNAEGETQTQDAAPPAPDGATGWHDIQVSVA